MSNCVRIGTRGSRLAIWQAEWCARELASRGVLVEIVPLVTEGDVTSGSLAEAGGEGLFTKRIQQGLLDDEVDIAVHSLKDLPTESIPGLTLSAVPPRESAHDVLVSRGDVPLEELPSKARVGTGSIRRRAQLLFVRPDLSMRDIRGNVESRISSLETGEFDAVVLAEAGLLRLGLEDRVSQVLSFSVMLPAAGQAALGLETREADERAVNAARLLDDPASHCAVRAERSLLRALRAGCLAPVGCRAWLNRDELKLEAVVLDPAGTQRLAETGSGPASSPESCGRLLAETLLQRGADRLIQLPCR